MLRECVSAKSVHYKWHLICCRQWICNVFGWRAKGASTKRQSKTRHRSLWQFIDIYIYEHEKDQNVQNHLFSTKSNQAYGTYTRHRYCDDCTLHFYSIDHSDTGCWQSQQTWNSLHILTNITSNYRRALFLF